MAWFDRTFTPDLPQVLLPGVIERLRGTPARLEERTGLVGSDRLTARPPDGSWSIQENAGHLLDLEPLWSGRVEDLMMRRTGLCAADLMNQRTHDAGHNLRPMAAILAEFRAARHALVVLIESFDEAAAMHHAMHPRLGQPMRLVDHATFVADHDDHHLARITTLLGAGTGVRRS